MFEFLGEATISQVKVGQKQQVFKGKYPSRQIGLELAILIFAYESPFGGGIQAEKHTTFKLNVGIPWLQKNPYRVGDKHPCAWVDGFGTIGRYIFKGLFDKVEKWESFPLLENRQTLWIKKEFLDEVKFNLPPHWELVENWVLMPCKDYRDIIIRGSGLLPSEYFLCGCIQNPQHHTAKYVDVINLEEGFAKAVDLRANENKKGFWEKGSALPRKTTQEYFKNQFSQVHKGDRKYS